jgi:hypothetical protein
VFNRFSKRAIFSLFYFLVLIFSSKNIVFAQSADSEIGDSANAFTLMPMFLPKGPSYNYGDLLIAMVKDQGYEAHCAAMQWTIDKKLLGNIEKFFSSSTPPEESFYNGLNPTIFGGVDPYIVDLTKARIPMFRGMEDKNTTQKNSSLEGMFGANYQTVQDSYMLNSSGVAKRVLSSYQQCLAKTQNLVSIEQICNEVTDECTINKKYNFKIAVDTNGSSRVVTDSEIGSMTSTEHVENVDFKMTDLLSWFQEIRPELSKEKLYQQVCFDIAGGDNAANSVDTGYTPPNVDINKIAKLREAVGRMPIDLDTLYRLAFLVLVPTQDPGKDDDGDKFYFLQEKPQIDLKIHAPIFIAFKIPDFATNKSRISGNIDSLELTKMILQPKEQNDKDLADQKDKRDMIYSLAQTKPDPVIHCPYPKCIKPLEKVLIDIINGTSPKCRNDTLRIIESTTTDAGEEIDASGFGVNERQATASAIEMIFNQEDLNWENAGDLFTPASKDMRQYSYTSDSNTEVANKLRSKFLNPFEWELTVDEDRPPLDPPMIVNAYLVVPIGENVKDVNKALSIFWSEEEFFDMIKTNVIEDMTNPDGTSKQGAIPKYYTIKDATFGISTSQQINPIDKCEYKEVIKKDKNGGWYTDLVETCSHYTFGFGFSDTTSKNESSSKGNLLIPDFGLGFMVRKIQQKLRNTFNQTYDYILSCQRVEDMFLGRCKGDPIGGANKSFCSGEGYKNIKNLPSATQIPQYAKDIFTAEIAIQITPELIEAYEYAEKETGIPCEVVAGIHWTEAGLDPTKSVFDGGSLRGTLKEDAKAAMEHLISKWQGSFDKNNIDYESLTGAIGDYNGMGNQNCARETRWKAGGKCPPKFYSEDHPHPLGWIDERHSDMDLVYCLDYTEFSCNTDPTPEVMSELRSSLDQSQAEYGFTDEKKEQLITDAAKYCYSNSSICQTLSEGRKYPKYERPGSLTTAILLNESGSGQ